MLFASQHDIDNFGTGTFGIAGRFLPLRLDPATINAPPVALAWQSPDHNHYVPLVWSAADNAAPCPVVNWPTPEQSIPSEIPDPFCMDPADSPKWAKYFERDCLRFPVREPSFIQSLLQQIRDSHSQVESMLRSGASLEEAHARLQLQSVPHQFLKPHTEVSFTGHQETSKGKALWNMARKKLKAAIVNGVAYDDVVLHEGTPVGVNDNESVVGAALRAFPGSASVQDITSAVITVHKSKIHMGGLAVALVRMCHEFALLARNPIEGVEVETTDMVWTLRVTHGDLPGPRKLLLTFPATYPHHPPRVELCGTAPSGQPVTKSFPVPACQKWTALDDARMVIQGVVQQLVKECRIARVVSEVSREYFALMDSDGDGVVGMTEGKEAMKAIYGIPDAEARSLWMRVLTKTDADADGELTAPDWYYFCSHAASLGHLGALRTQIEQMRKAGANTAGFQA